MASKTILICDDEPDIISILSDFLSSSNHNVICCSDGSQAYDLILKTKPDVIISDIKMPNLSGLDLLKKLNDDNIITPVIYLTAYATRDLRQIGYSLGQFDMIGKPFDLEEVANAVNKALSFSDTTSTNKSALNSKLLAELKKHIYQHD